MSQRRTPRRSRRSLAPYALTLIAGATVLCACSRARVRSPETLRERYQDALENNDPDAAYALLAPEVQAKTGPKEFRERWNAQAAERTAALAGLASIDKAHEAAVHGGTTAHGSGWLLRWTELDGEYRIVDGLPGLPNMSTPAATVRSLIAAIRSADLGRLVALLGDDLAGQMRDEWNRRADALAELIQDPGAIEYSPDMRRAVLRYEPGRALTLEQSERGWQIIALQ